MLESGWRTTLNKLKKEPLKVALSFYISTCIRRLPIEQRKMIIVSINGGLGNQLFQYAFGKHLEHLHGEEVLFDLSAFDNPEHRPFALHHFSVTIKEASQNELPFIFRKNFKNFRLISKLLDKTLYPCRLITQKQFNFDAYYLEKIKNAHYWGSWQSEQYFSGVKGTIKNNFTFKKATSQR